MTSLGARLRELRINKEWRFIIAISLLAFLFKLFLLTQRSLYIDPDEGYYLILARNLIAGKGYTFNGLPNIIFPPFLPLLAAVFYFFLHNLQLSLAIITSLSGTLLGIVVYLIARKKMAFLPSFGCLLLTLFIYELNAFLPVSARYTRVLYRGSDILNCLLILTSIYFAARLLEKGRYLLAALAGSGLALAYLTRPEGFLLFIGLLGLFVLLRTASVISVSYRKLACLLVVFLLLSSPYLLYLKKTTGKWTLSGKISASQKYRAALVDVIRNENWQPFYQIHYSLNREATEMNDLYFGFHRQSDIEAGSPSGSAVSRAKSNLALFWIIPKALFPLPFLPFFVLGLIVAVGKGFRRKSTWDLALLILVPYSLLVEALSYPIPRHHLFLVPLLVVYTVEGALFLSSKLAPKDDLTARKILVLVIAVLFIFTVYDHVINGSRNLLNIPVFAQARQAEVALSHRLKERGAGVVMSSNPSFAVWASSDWQVLPKAPVNRIIQFGKRKRVDFIILPEETRFFYHVVDVEASALPGDTQDFLEFQVLEKADGFDFVRVVKKAEDKNH